MRLRAFVGVGLALLLVAGPAAAQWKWKDARGQVVVSDLPPPRDIPESHILQRPELIARRPAQQAAAASAAASAPAAAPVVAKAKVDPELEARRKKAEQDEKDKAKAEEQKLAAQRADNCRRARSHMATLDSGIRLSRTNDKGEREVLDDKQRAEEVARTRAVIASDCR
ncbi:MAG: DUF4124 domain-containing protein [Ideonella sp.]|nr:DUF4124 domain-containing protein [Ideonella sp.]MCC7456811.1 DUF4124 domain-containing protein [Nitrospira sp.]